MRGAFAAAMLATALLYWCVGAAAQSDGQQFDPATNSWVWREVSVRSIARRANMSHIPPEIVPFGERRPEGTIIVDTGERHLDASNYLAVLAGI